MNIYEEYQPIENYGVVGDLNTIALVGLNGSIDFLCFPDFHSPTVFAALLDKNKGGYFRISPAKNSVKYKQLYLPDTNVLLTKFLETHGVAEITDFMPVKRELSGNELVRIVTCVNGELTFSLECCPRFDYARTGHSIEKKNEKEILFFSDDAKHILRLISTVPLEISGLDSVASFSLKTGEKAIFLLEYLTDKDKAEPDIENFANDSLYETIDYWKDWMNRSKYEGRWREIVNRSALALKLMTSQKHGSIIAAPTFGLPEEIGGIRNWDYRYTWIRDASFTVYTLLKLGYKKEAREFIQWVEKLCDDIHDEGQIRLMYSIDGEKELCEEELKHFAGYKNSVPVRIGNEAYKQVQLDMESCSMLFIYIINMLNPFRMLFGWTFPGR
jgi:GH15 family glucan-1,4-alpha-glucosidase